MSFRILKRFSTFPKQNFIFFSQFLNKIPRKKKFVYIFLSAYFVNRFNNFYFKCIEDQILTNAKLAIEKGIYELKSRFGTQMMSFPQVNYSTQGGKYKIDFLVDQRKCDLFALILAVLNKLEENKEKNHFLVKNVTGFKEGFVVTLQIEYEIAVDNYKKRQISNGTIYVSGELTYERANIKFILEKEKDISEYDIAAFLEAYREANEPKNVSTKKENFSKGGTSINQQPSFFNKNQKENKADKSDYQKLRDFGITLFLPEEKNFDLDWDYLAGYEEQKRDIEDTVLLALSYPEIFDSITKETRMKNEPNRPKCVLFEGPPGTGKTTSAKIIAQQVNIPLAYMPIESIMSKFYGESEKRFADIFDACKNIGKSILFIDEIDAIAMSRGEGIHEASRRILSTLLRRIDSFESTTDVLVICATNRKEDLDPAILSRIDISIKFELPDKLSRQAIFKRYAKHLNQKELEKLANASEGMSGRNISDICKDAERRWASKFIRKEATEKLPPLIQYISALDSRKNQNL